MFKNIQYLRGIAALLVAIGHNLQLVSAKVYATGIQPIRHFENTSAVGVDIFFVISGFIMFYISGADARGLRSTLLFWGKRITRVMPVYWICTTVVLGFYLSGIPQSKIDFSWYYIGRSYLLLPVLNLLHEMHPIVPVGWTLVYEMFFYFVFGLLLLLPQRSRLPLISALLVTLTAVGYLVVPQLPKSIVLYTYTSPMLLEFLYGIWLAALYRSGFCLPRYASIGLMVAGFFFLFQLYLGVESSRAFVSGIPAMAVVAGAIMLEQKSRSTGVGHPQLKLIGDTSYSLYLTHPVMLYGISFAVRHLPGTPTGGVIAFVFATVVEVIAAIFFFKLVERPLTDALQDRFFKKKKKEAVPA